MKRNRYRCLGLVSRRLGTGLQDQPATIGVKHDRNDGDPDLEKLLSSHGHIQTGLKMSACSGKSGKPPQHIKAAPRARIFALRHTHANANCNSVLEVNPN